MSSRLKDKVCFISGAGRKGGICRGIANVFAKHGAQLILMDILPIDEEELNKDIKLATILTIECDVTSEKSIVNAIVLIKSKLKDKRIDVVVNGAAIFIFKDILESLDSDWSNIYNVNVKGYALIIKHIVNIMNKGGSIINIASISGIRAQGKAGSMYNSTKAAIIQLSKNAALDLWDKYKIRVNTVSPGITMTYNLKDVINKAVKDGLYKDYNDWFKFVEKYLIIKRLGTVQEIGNAVLFFACDESKYCTATNLVIDGGWSAL